MNELERRQAERLGFLEQSDYMKAMSGSQPLQDAGRSFMDHKLSPGAPYMPGIDSPGGWAVGDILKMIPDLAPGTGDVMAGVYAKEEFDKGNYGLSALNAIGVAPVVPALGKFGGLAFAGIFAGKKAKTADLDALKKAEGMTAAGLDRDAIWKETGWYSDVDGKWKFEIDDSGVRAKPLGEWSRASQQDFDAGNGTMGSVSEFIEHDDLASAYDEVMDFGGSDKRTLMDVNAGRLGGSFSQTRINGVKDAGYIRVGTATTNAGPFTADKSATLHELQHVVQSREGFARGGSPEMFEEKDMTMELKSPIFIKQLDILNNNPTFDALKRDIRMKLSEIEGKHGSLVTDKQGTSRTRLDWNDVPKADFDSYMNMQREVRKLPAFDDYAKLEFEAAMLDESDNVYSPFKQYTNLSGEAEARNVQTRMDYSAADRKEKPPWSTLDVDQADLFTRMDD